jgi:hypothetical protein
MIISEITIFNEMGFMPALYLMKSLAIIKGKLDDFKLYLPDRLNTLIDRYIQSVYIYLSQSFEIKTNIDKLKYSVGKIIECFKKNLPQADYLYEFVNTIEIYFDKILVLIPIKSEISKNDYRYYLNLITEISEELIQDPCFIASELDKMHFRRLLLLFESIFDQNF